jgi:hypothetical protein
MAYHLIEKGGLTATVKESEIHTQVQGELQFRPDLPRSLVASVFTQVVFPKRQAPGSVRRK